MVNYIKIFIVLFILIVGYCFLIQNNNSNGVNGPMHDIILFIYMAISADIGVL